MRKKKGSRHDKNIVRMWKFDCVSQGSTWAIDFPLEKWLSGCPSPLESDILERSPKSLETKVCHLGDSSFWDHFSWEKEGGGAKKKGNVKAAATAARVTKFNGSWLGGRSAHATHPHRLRRVPTRVPVIRYSELRYEYRFLPRSGALATKKRLSAVMRASIEYLQVPRVDWYVIIHEVW